MALTDEQEQHLSDRLDQLEITWAELRDAVLKMVEERETDGAD